MKYKKKFFSFVAVIVTAALIIFCNPFEKFTESSELTSLTVAIAPYQDLAMLVNASSLNFDAKEGLNLKLVTMAWEDILPAVASAGKTVDIGFGSYVEYLTKFSKINEGSDDPVIYIQPLYVYKGGGFIALSHEISPFHSTDLSNPEIMQRIKEYKIGAQKQSLYDMMIYSVARRGGVNPKELKIFDTPMNDGLLALETKSLDLAAAGLTQVTEARKRGGKIVISMEDAGFADITGFICRKSTLQAKRQEIEALIRIWYQCVDYVYSNIEKNSVHSLEYLRKNAATKYSYGEYVQALSQEYLPKNLEELSDNVLTPGAKYDYKRIGNSINDYLITNKIVYKPTPIPEPLMRK